MHAKYRFADDAIVYEIIQNEVVLVNLDSGYYYILDDIASVIWLSLKDGSPVVDIVRSLLATYSAPRETIQSGVEELIAEFVRENIFRHEPASVAAAPDASIEVPQPPAGRRAFHLPTMSKFTDMKYVIPLDPIWDYDETGWPKRRTNPPADKK